MKIIMNVFFVMVVVSVGGVGQQPISVKIDPVRDQGLARVTVTNNGVSPISGFAIYAVYVQPGGSRKIAESKLFYDSSLRENDLPVPQNGSRTLAIGPTKNNVTGEVIPPTVTVPAVVFTDGSSYGDPTAIQLLRQRRLRTAAALKTVLDVLKTAEPNEQNYQQLLGKLRAIASPSGSSVVRKEQAMISAIANDALADFTLNEKRADLSGRIAFVQHVMAQRLGRIAAEEKSISTIQ